MGFSLLYRVFGYLKLLQKLFSKYSECIFMNLLHLFGQAMSPKYLAHVSKVSRVIKNYCLDYYICFRYIDSCIYI